MFIGCPAFVSTQVCPSLAPEERHVYRNGSNARNPYKHCAPTERGEFVQKVMLSSLRYHCG
jgi:hypothetical protein